MLKVSEPQKRIRSGLKDLLAYRRGDARVGEVILSLQKDPFHNLERQAETMSCQ